MHGVIIRGIVATMKVNKILNAIADLKSNVELMRETIRETNNKLDGKINLNSTKILEHKNKLNKRDREQRMKKILYTVLWRQRQI